MDRRHELIQLRRSIAMLPPSAPALDREQALRLLAEIEQAIRRYEQLRRQLHQLLADS